MCRYCGKRCSRSLDPASRLLWVQEVDFRSARMTDSYAMIIRSPSVSV